MPAFLLNGIIFGAICGCSHSSKSGARQSEGILEAHYHSSRRASCAAGAPSTPCVAPSASGSDV